MDNLSILDNFNNIKSIQDSIRKRKDYVGDIKTKNLIIMARRTRRPKPMTPKAGVTKRNRRYALGGKLK